MKEHEKTLHEEISDSRGWDMVLFSVLREHRDKPEVARVETILGLLVAAETNLRERETTGFRMDRAKGRPAEARVLAHKWQDSQSAYVRALTDLNQMLKRYRWQASIDDEQGHFRHVLLPVCPAVSSTDWRWWEPSTVAILLTLTSEPGKLNRFRKCSECHEWFYASTGHQHFCGDSCRRRHAARNPEFKEKRRIYMRERYRPLQKELQERSLAAAKETRPKKERG